VDSGPENSFSQGRPSNDAFLPGESPRGASKIRSEADQVKRPPKKSPGELMSKTGREQKLTRQSYFGARVSSSELRELQRTLRELQQPFAATFWHLSQFLARLDDELLRRRP
jgi:hypothetical protein